VQRATGHLYVRLAGKRPRSPQHYLDLGKRFFGRIESGRSFAGW
jgi:hypothetical protein